MPAGDELRTLRRQAGRARRRLGAALLRAADRLGGRTGTVGPGARAGGAAGRVAAAHEAFFRTLERDGDLALAATALVRRYLEAGAARRARTLGQVLAKDIGEVGSICLGVADAREGLTDSAWRRFGSVDLAEVLRTAPAEYLRVAFELDPGLATKTLEALLGDGYATAADAAGWLDIAQTGFAAGAVDLSAAALERARTALGGRAPVPAAPRLRAEVDWLAQWYPRAEAAHRAAAPADGEIPLAVAGYRQPDRRRTSRDRGDYLEGLAVLAALTRRPGVRFAGDPALAAFADALRTRTRGGGAPSGADAVVRLYEVDRDATRLAAVPDGTWLIVCGLLPRPMFDARAGLPPDPRLRPIYLSVHLDSVDPLTPQTLDHLRRHAPIGCRDWASVFLLLAAGVPAFFAGAVAATLDVVLGEAAASGSPLFVDVPGGGGKDAAAQVSDAVRERSLVENLGDCLAGLDDYRSRRRVVTSRLQTYIACRALGVKVDLRTENPSERQFDGLLGIGDAAFAEMRRSIGAKLDAVLEAILSGAAEADVYARWRDLCAPDVAEAWRRRAEVRPPRGTSFDIAAACAAIRAAATTVERTSPAPDGAEINVEFSLDGNYKHQLEVVLDSIVTHTARPVRAFVLCRDHGPADHDRLAALFPGVSFEWLPMDAVDYGRISGLLRYTTVATMDRLLLPELLPEVGRIVHHDLDALCLADLGELHDLDLRGTPLAARTSPHPLYASGFAAFLKRAQQFDRDPARGREYLRLTHARHAFDFGVLNAGIMLLDLAAMRTDGFCREFLPYVERFGLNDQSVLNLYAGPNRVELAAGWNWRPWLETVPEPRIAHWAGEYKPWSRPWVVGKDLWRAAETRLAARYGRAGLPVPAPVPAT